MPRNIEPLKANVIQAQEALADALYDEMAREAIKLGLDEIVITQLGNQYTKGGKIVAPNTKSFDRINKLDAIYSDYVHDGGFDESVWTQGKGWR